MENEYFIIKMVIYMKENLKMVILKVMVFSLLMMEVNLMVIDMKENGKIMYMKEKELTFIKMEENMKEIGKMEI